MNYLIQADENLSQISHRQLGNYLNWREIADLNNINIFDEVLNGRSIRIPNQNELQAMLRTRAEQLLRDASNQAIESVLSNVEASASLPELDLSGLRLDGRTVNPWQLISWLN